MAAVDVGGTSIKAALVDQGGGRHRLRRLPVANLSPEKVVDAVLRVVDQLLVEGRQVTDSSPVAVGLAVPGLVDEAGGIARSSMILGWREVPFRELLARAGLPVAFGHDVLSAAYAEAVRGSAVGYRDWLFLALGTGLGAAFILDGRPYRGAAGRGGELAHVVVRSNGPVCRCGKRGCAEMLASAEAVVTAFRNSSTAPAVTGAIEVVRLAQAGDSSARAVWEDALAALAEVVAGYVESMDPSVIVVGGGLSEAGDALFDPLTRLLRDRVAYAAPTPPVRRATFGQDAGLVGIALAAHELAGHPDRLWTVPFANEDRS